MPSSPRFSRGALALIAFVGHAPGLWWFARRRLGPRALRVNLVAVALTLLAMAVAHGFPGGDGPWGRVLVAWLVGHFSWSCVLAAWVFLGGATMGRG